MWPTGKKSASPGPVPCGKSVDQFASVGRFGQRLRFVKHDLTIGRRRLSPDSDQTRVVIPRPQIRSVAPTSLRRQDLAIHQTQILRPSDCPSPPCGIVAGDARRMKAGVRRLGRESAIAGSSRQHRAEHDQQRSFEKLHIRRRDHAGGDHDQHDHRPHHAHAYPMGKSQQRLDQRSGPDHLRNQIKHAHGQRADAGRKLDRSRLEATVQRIGKV